MLDEVCGIQICGTPDDISEADTRGDRSHIIAADDFMMRLRNAPSDGTASENSKRPKSNDDEGDDEEATKGTNRFRQQQREDSSSQSSSSRRSSSRYKKSVSRSNSQSPTEHDLLLNDRDQELPTTEKGSSGEDDNMMVISPSKSMDSAGDQSGSSVSVKTVVENGFDTIKYVGSTALLGFSVFLIVWTMFDKETTATQQQNIHPAITLGVFVLLIVWLGLIEGGQGCLVGLQPVAKSIYANSHRRSLKCAVLGHKGDNLERFMVGRQFLVVLVIFAINTMSSTVAGASVLGLPQLLLDMFLNTGLAVMLTTVTVGQLTAQVNSANCMLDFVNNYYMLFTIYVSLAIEASGAMHAVYLINIVFAKLSGTPVESKEPPRTPLLKCFFWGRVLFSLAILVGAFYVTLTALFEGRTMMWAGVPTAAAVTVFFVLMCLAGIMEGMQIALFAVVNLPEEELENYPLAYRNCQLVFAGHNLGAFLIGRQICVTGCMFVVARITNIDVDMKNNPQAETILGVDPWVQEFFNTGLLGAVITTIIASLVWRVVASSFPIAFLSNPVVYVIIRFCLMLEQSGVCSVSWLLAGLQKWLLKLQPDEVYFAGTEMGNRNNKAATSP